jgi:DMSO reductase anchor subunit
MHPAASIIGFTVASGAGYGLLAWLGLHSLVRPPTPTLGLLSLGIGLVAVTGGLLSSTFHLGHPERAWRALSQWRSSWLSREGIVALAVYPPAVLFGAALLVPETFGAALRPAALAMAVLAIATVLCTAMIYASLKPIAAWWGGRTVAVYAALAGSTGILWFAAIVLLAGAEPPFLAPPLVVLSALAWLAVRFHWRQVDAPGRAVDPLGLGDTAQIRPLDPPHTEENYLQREMGFRIARKHAAKLRLVFEVVGCGAPIVLSIATLWLPLGASAAVLLLAALAATLGAVVQRWLFFAEAKHLVMAYYEGT